MFHITQPLGISGLLDGYFFRWCPIFPKWDIYQPLVKIMYIHVWHYDIDIMGHPRHKKITMQLATGRLGTAPGPVGRPTLANQRNNKTGDLQKWWIWGVSWNGSSIIHLNSIFHYKPSILGCSRLWKPHMMQTRCKNTKVMSSDKTAKNAFGAFGGKCEQP